MSGRLRIFLTVDVGPDDAVLGAGVGSQGSWDRTESGLAVLGEVIRGIADECEADAAATWLLRADRLIAEQFGERLAIFDRFEAFIERCLRGGHEIGWMPQLYPANGGRIDLDDLAATHAAIVSRGPAPRCVRMGNCYHDNETMQALSRLGVSIDSSAVPGRKRSDAAWRMDWVGTPQQAYHPSVADYRRPGTPQLDILELPLSVLPVEAPYDPSPLLRYLNPCMRREYLWPHLVERIASSAYLVAALHPDEVVPGDAGHPLIAYDPDELRCNLRELIGAARRSGREVSFETLSSFPANASPSD